MDNKEQYERRETLLLHSGEPGAVETAGRLLRAGGLVAIPTETVYGLAANTFSPDAVAAIFRAKGRPADNPLIVHIAQFETLGELVTEIPPQAKMLADAFWPGPLTMILPKKDRVPEIVSAGLSTVAVRFPSHPDAHAIIQASGVPLAAPSANRSGSPSPTTAQHVLDDMDGRIDAIFDGGPCEVGLESTVISLAGSVPCLLRPGGVTLEMLREVLGEVRMDEAVLKPLKKGVAAASPGMKYKHYAPRARVVILDGAFEAYKDYVNSHNEEGTVALCFSGEEKALCVPALTLGGETDGVQQAHRLFDALRETDRIGAKLVFARCPSKAGVGLAVYNRLIRAAGFEVRKL